MTENKLLQDRYELIERVGSGGMAEVWRARDTRLGRDVAVKFLDEKLLGDPESHVRFFTEAQAAARISHPNVVKVLDFGQTEDIPYLVMEYVPGGTLAALIGEPMDVDRALDLVAQAARGAAALHAEGLVHRDLKPANILLDDNGTVKVTDLGIAAGRAAEHMTATGAAIGSPHYISPEQVSGKEAIPASDIYSLGVVLFEALTGKKPFDGENVTAIAIAHVDKAPPAPSDLRPDLPAEIDALVLRCMEKRPEQRFEDGAALAAALAAPTGVPAFADAEATSSISVVEESPVGAKARIPAGAILVVLLILASAAVVAARMGGEQPAVAGQPVAEETADGRKKASPTPSPTEEAREQAVAPSPTPDEEKDKEPTEEASSSESKSTAKKNEPKSEPTEEPSSEPSPQPSSEPSPQPKQSTAPEAQSSPAP